MTTLDQVKAIIGDAVGLPAADIQDNAMLGARVGLMTDGRQYLDTDSLDRLELAMAFEEAFAIEIPDADTEQPEMVTPAGIAAYIDRRVREGWEDKDTPRPDEMAAGIIHEPGTVDDSPAETPVDTPLVWRRKAVDIEAVEFRGIVDGMATFGRADLPEWLAEALSMPDGNRGSIWLDYEKAGRATAPALMVGRVNDIVEAKAGDWIVQFRPGQVAVLMADHLAKDYDPVPADDGGDAHEAL